MRGGLQLPSGGFQEGPLKIKVSNIMYIKSLKLHIK